ncbi:MAG: CsiV family protein [Marinobacter sp.]
MRTPAYLLHGTSILTLAILLTLSPLASAQQASDDIPLIEVPQERLSNGQASEKEEPREDYYRAEFVIIERKVGPETLDERMASRIPEPPSPDMEEILQAVNQDGSDDTTLELVSRSDLHLNSAANRLENSGRFRVLLATGWYQSFPPDFEGEPLRVDIGEWLEDAGHREVQGQITIDRQRYLHVGVQLNHWQPMPSETTTTDDGATDAGDEARIQTIDDAGDLRNTADGEVPIAGDIEASIATLATGGEIVPDDQALIAGANWPRAELLTWIRETRRMRSEEVHFLDSPTIGVLVFFKKIEE